MKKCILCGKPTEGSVGAAGIHWTCICQQCKDLEDQALESQIKAQGIIFNTILPSKEVP